MKTLIVNKELPGFLSDRLQEALWREGLHIINDGYASTKDLDEAITYGPGTVSYTHLTLPTKRIV